jgi:hypothetical protein
MNWGMIGIIFANIVLLLLLGTLLFRTRWAWTIKGAAVASVVFLYYATFISYPSYAGWPTTIRPPERFSLLGVIFEEPNKSTQTRGRIFLWATDMKTLDNQKPRAYELPYSPLLHSKLYDAGQKLRKQIPQLGEVEIVRNPITAKEEIGLQFFDMPDVMMPK